MACEEEALWRRYQLELAVAQDEIPPGFEPEDFEFFGLPVPSRRASPDAPVSEVVSAAADDAQPARQMDGNDNPFVCDAPARS